MPAPAHHLLTPQVVGRYALYGEIASGGMASVQFGRLLGAAGFQRTVAIKRLHPQYASDENFVQQFTNEARLASHISHPNVVQTFDVVRDANELLLVMEYVHGETLSRLMRGARQAEGWIPEAVGLSIICDALRGLHAAHEATDEAGQALGIVHRDISPENIVVDSDGRAAVLDFGIAKAQGALFSTDGQQLKGKFRYMSPEQVRGKKVDRRADIFAMGITLFRVLTKRHVFGNQQDAATMLYRVLHMPVRKASMIVQTISPELDAAVMRSLERDPDSRFATAEEFALALEEAAPIARRRDVGLWVEAVAGRALDERASLLREISAHSQSGTFRISSKEKPAGRESPVLERVATQELEAVPPSPPFSTREAKDANRETAGANLALARVWPARPRDVILEYPAPSRRRYLAYAFAGGVVLASALAAIFWRFSTSTATTDALAEISAPRPSSARKLPAQAAPNKGAPGPATDVVDAPGASSIATPASAAPLAKPKLKTKRTTPSVLELDADPLSRRH